MLYNYFMLTKSRGENNMEKNEILAKLEAELLRLENLGLAVADLGRDNGERNEKYHMASTLAGKLEDTWHMLKICKEDIEENLKDKVSKDKYKIA